MRPVQRPNQRIAVQPKLNQQRRTVTHVQPYWLNMNVGFTDPAIANENKIAATETEGFDMIVRAAWSNLAAARVQLKLGGQTKDSLSDRQVPILAQIGNSDKVEPLLYWRNPVLLAARQILQGRWVNTGSETDGRVNFYGEKVGANERIEVSKSIPYWLLVDLTSTSLLAKTTAIDEDLLIWAATTNVAVTVLGQVFDESSKNSWSADQIPIRAWAGVQAQVQPFVEYHRPYLLRARTQLRVEFSAAAAGQYVAFRCERLLA